MPERATAKATLSAPNGFVKNDLRAGRKLLKDAHPDAYAALREASPINATGSREGPSKKGDDLGAATGQP